VAVKRAPITQTVTLDGQVMAEDQVPITYPGKTKVRNVPVAAGQSVKQGDLLVEVYGDGGVWALDMQNNINLAQARETAAEGRLADAQAQAQVRQDAAAEQAAYNQRQQQQLVSDADASVRRAQDNLTRVKAGSSAADRQAAQDAVDAATAALQKATDAQDKLANGPDDTTIRAAKRDVDTAQVTLDKAQADYDKLTKGADATTLRDAEALVQSAKTKLQLAQAANPDPKQDPAVAQNQIQVAIQDAQLAEQNAEDRLAKLKQPPDALDVQAAKQRVQDAKDAVAAAGQRLDLAQAGPDDDSLAAAQAAVDRTQSGLDVAQGRLADVNNHPTPSELADAQDQVRKAQVAADATRATPAAAVELSTPEVAAAEDAVHQAQADIERLQQALEETKVTAPFDGTVVSVNVIQDAVVSPTTTLLVLARPGPPKVHVVLSDDQVGVVRSGQTGNVLLANSRSSDTVPATITSVTPPSKNGAVAASADAKVSWPTGVTPPRLGSPVQVALVVGGKDDALVVPLSAVRRVGDRATVEVQDGMRQKRVNVTLGIVTDDSAEIVSGLSEGQLVVAGTTTTGAAYSGASSS
jgi:multidrug efflux pump subunit AcrA (membrane-fusion protein)